MKKRLWTKILVICLAVIISVPVPALAGGTPTEPTPIYYGETNTYENYDYYYEDEYEDEEDYAPDTTMLIMVIADAQSLLDADLDLDAYTLAVLYDALTEAIAVLYDPYADQYAIDDAIAALDYAITAVLYVLAQLGEYQGIVALGGTPGTALIVPQFLPGVDPNFMTVTIFDGTLAWTTTLANMVNPAWTPPGGIQRLTFNNVLGGFEANDSGLFTVVFHGPLELVRANAMGVGTFLPYGPRYHTVVTYLYVTQAQIDVGDTINLLVESNRRSEVLPHQFSNVPPWTDLNTQPPASHPLRDPLLNDGSGLHQQRGWVHRWESMQNSNSTNTQMNHHHQVRLPSFQDRYEVDGNWTIAPFPGQATNAPRTSDNRFALGSPIAPWTGPGHFQSPAFRDNIYCPTTGWLIGNASNRSLYQWTTHYEMLDFINALNAVTPHMYVFWSGYVPHAFTWIANRMHFQVPFVVFSTTDLSAYAAVNDWEGAGRAIQANGRPTVWYGAGHHGNEASAREAGLNVIHSMATTPWGLGAAAEVNVIIYPDYSPTSHLMHSRDSMTVSNVRPATYPGMTGQAAFDLNRDHMTLFTQEVFLQRSVWMAFMPHIVLDGHELTGWNYTAAGVYNNADDFQISTSTTPNTPYAVIEVAGSMLIQQFQDFADSGMRIAHFGNTTNPTISRPFYGHMGAASYVLETRGQVAGLQARRTYAGYLSVRSFIEYARANAAVVTGTINNARANIIDMGTYYDPINNRIALHSAALPLAANPDNRLPTAAQFQRFNLTLDGGYTAVAGTTLPRIGVQRDRSRPTGYVILLGDNYDWQTRALGPAHGNPPAVNHSVVVPYEGIIAQLRRVLSGQRIEHYFLPEGTVLYLAQYRRISATENPHNQAFLTAYGTYANGVWTVNEFTYVTIPAGGAYFIPMDQVQGTIIALLMEPDVRDALPTAGATPANNFGSSLVQQMIHAQPNNIRYDGSRTIFCCPVTQLFPIFRFTEDNPRDFVPITLTPEIVIVSDATPVVNVEVGGTAAVAISYNRGTLPAAVAISVNQTTRVITLTGTRPPTGSPAITGMFDVTVTRGNVTETLTVAVNLTPIPWVPDPGDGGGGQQPPVTPPILPNDDDDDTTPPILPDNPFIDIADDAWYFQYIMTVWQNELFQGTTANTFNSQGNMTRAMFAQVLLNLYDGDPVFITSSFTDVSTTAWYFTAVEWAASLGIVEGVGNDRFAPHSPITREQIAVMLYRFVNVKDIDIPQGAADTFADQAYISYWAVDAVRAIQAAGVIMGHPDGRFAPQGTATRAHVAAMFARLLDSV